MGKLEEEASIAVLPSLGSQMMLSHIVVCLFFSIVHCTNLLRCMNQFAQIWPIVVYSSQGYV